MKTIYLTAALASTVLLAACGEKDQTSATATEASAAAEASANMVSMAKSDETTTAKSTGTVTAIDKALGKVTLAHEPIPEVSWPAMTMAFDAKPAVLEGVAVGDKVAFDVTIKGNAGEVTAISKQ